MTILESFEKLDYSEALESSSEAQKWLEEEWSSIWTIYKW